MKWPFTDLTADANASLPVRGAWIEILATSYIRHILESLPVRGAWIEIAGGVSGGYYIVVAPRKGSVD